MTQTSLIKGALAISRGNKYHDPMPISSTSRSKHLRNLEAEAFVSLLRSADALVRSLERTLAQASLSPPQYNVLRILRGAGSSGLCCREIGDRMITRDPDITRLLDRLEARELVTRARRAKDRRVISVSITKAGLTALDGLDKPVEAFHRRSLGHLGELRLRALIELLEKVVESCG